MKHKTIKMSKEEKTSLTILIHEIQECKTREEIDRVLDSWITANNLHPENVRTFQNKDELNAFLELEKAPYRIK